MKSRAGNGCFIRWRTWNDAVQSLWKPKTTARICAASRSWTGEKKRPLCVSSGRFPRRSGRAFGIPVHEGGPHAACQGRVGLEGNAVAALKAAMLAAVRGDAV